MGTIKLSSDMAFYSIQGEGASLGVPAVFLRVAHCTLDCVWCDTAAVWKKSHKLTYAEVYAMMKENGCIAALNHGAHLVLTGGSPLLQQRDLAGLVSYMLLAEGKEHFDWYIECETEATLLPNELIPFVAQWNVSPKLSNSGMPLARRYHPDVLQWHNVNGKSFFKFPVTMHDRDIQEVLSMVNAIRIPRNKVFLMPVASNRMELNAFSREIVELAKFHYFGFSTRLHLSIWDQATGV